MNIREVTAADAEHYYALRLQSEQEFPQFAGFNAERELSAGPTGIAGLLEAYPAEGTIVWGAFEDSQLLAVTALSRRLSPKYRHKAFLWGMYAKPEFRGGTVARALLENAIAWAKRDPEVMAISLQVTTSNVRAQRFYDRYGFRIFGTERRSLLEAGEFHDAHYMELECK